MTTLIRHILRRADRHIGVLRWLACLTLVWVTGASSALVYAQGAGLAVRLTSPQGRLNSTGPIRIVAQATPAQGTTVAKVTFWVNDVAVGEDAEGPIYAVEWMDANPFETVSIRVEAVDAAGAVAEDRVTLPAMDITDETTVASVLLDVAVLDTDGRYVSGLTREHFALREDGVTQAIELVEPSRMPTVVTLLVDTSQSMSSRFDFVRRATRRLASLLRPDDQLAVVPFSRTLGAVTGPTRDLEALTSAIEGMHTRGGTAIADALEALAVRLAGVAGRQIIVLVTDGYDEHSAAGMPEAVAAVKKINATLYSVGIGGVAGLSFRGRDVLRELAGQTGGKAFFPSRDTEIPLVQDYIHGDVVSRYLLTYTPSNQTRDGQWRRILLKTGTPEHVIKTRDGYFAAAPLPIRPSIEFTITSGTAAAVVVGREDIEAIEDGVPQAIDTFQEAVAPVSILLALDESGSMRKAAEDVKAAALSFVDAVRDEDRLGVILFSDGATLATDLTLSRVVPRMTVDTYTSRGGTALYDAVRVGLDRLATVEGRRVVVVLTDGRDENGPGTAPGSRTTLDELLGRVRDVDAAIFAIGMGPNVDRDTLEQIARASGGQAYFPATVDELPAHYAQVVEDLRRRYVLSYTSTNTTRDGTWRQVDLKPRREDTHDHQPRRLPRSRAMTDGGKSGGQFTPKHALRPLAGLLVGAAMLRTTVDPDLWGHLRFGLDLLVTHRLTTDDPYSFTQDVAWINHEWLSEFVLGASYAFAGAAGLLVVKWFLLGIALTLAWRHSATASPAWRHGLLALATLGLLPISSTIRPQLWTVALIVLLWRSLATESIARWLIPLLFAVWANVHGGWSLGLGLLAVCVAGDVATRRRSLREAGLLLAASATATLLNPYGIELWRFILTTVRPERADITEWQPVWRSPPEYLALWLVGTATIAVAWPSVSQPRLLLARIPAVAMLALGALLVNRLVPLYVLVVVLSHGNVLRAASPQVRVLTRTVIDLTAATAALLLLLAGRSPTCIAMVRPSASPSPGPTALATLISARPSGRLVTYFDWGQEALFHLGPRLKVSIDGRRETVYSSHTLAEQYAIARGAPEGLVALGRLRPEFVWLPLPFSQATRAWLKAHDYRVDVENDKEFLAVRADLPFLVESASAIPATCFPGP